MKHFFEKRWQLILCCTGFILNLWAYHPGFMSPDSIDQFKQAITGEYSDWHPLAMSVLWHFFNKVYVSPITMLTFQLACLWCSCYLWLGFIKSGLWQTAIVLFFLAPFVQNFAGYIIKDSQMALSWLLALSILIMPLLHNRRIGIIGSIVSALLLLYGASVRFNALPGLLPLVFLWSYLVFNNHKIRIHILASLLFVITLIASQSILNFYCKPQKTYPQNKLYLHDLTGVFVKTHQNVFPDFLYKNSNFDTSRLRKEYTTATFDNIWWNKDAVPMFQEWNDSTTKHTKDKWLHTIQDNTAVYLQNRLEGFEYYLRIKDRNAPLFTQMVGIMSNDFGLVFHRNVLTTMFTGLVTLQSGMPYMKPWFWFFLNIALLGFVKSFRNKSYRLIYTMIVLSGVLYQLPSFFIFQIDTDFRYFYWNCIACSIAICLLLANRIISKQQAEK